MAILQRAGVDQVVLDVDDRIRRKRRQCGLPHRQGLVAVLVVAVKRVVDREVNADDVVGFESTGIDWCTNGDLLEHFDGQPPLVVGHGLADVLGESRRRDAP